MPATHRDCPQQHAGQVSGVPLHRTVGTEGHKLVGQARLKSIKSRVEEMDLFAQLSEAAAGNGAREAHGNGG